MIEICAEIGKNFVDTEEEQPIPVLLDKAKTLILEAKKAGADVVKFQTHCYPDEVHPTSELKSPHFDQDRLKWIMRNTYPFSFWREIKDYCDVIGIEFFSTPMSRGAAILLNEVGIKRWKVGSGDITDFVMLDYIRNTGKPVIISSGMSTIQELKKAYDYLAEKVEDVTIIHCVSQYPCPLEDLNLLTIPFLKKQFPRAKIGFSDHSLEVSSGAWARRYGAVVFEKHFTLSRNSWGSDHIVSLEPSEFKQYIKEIKEVAVPVPKQAEGVKTKFINEREMEFRKVFRKGLYAGTEIKEGQIITENDIIALRPKGEAIKSELYPDILGTIAAKNYRRYDAIK